MMRRIILTTIALSLGAAACGGDPKPAQVIYEAPAAGLQAEPRWLTFTCVEPGCDSSLVTAVSVVGDRDVAIKRVVLSDRERTDFTLVTSEETPFILKPGKFFEIETRFQPDGDPRLGDVNVLVTFADASANESDDGRIEPGELEVPLVRRLVGEASMLVSPEVINFGGLEPGEEARLPVTIDNTGFGNVGLVIESAQTDLAEVTIENMPDNAILPGEAWDIELVFRPFDERFTEGELTIKSADALAEPAKVKILGTSIRGPALLSRPETGIDFGEVPVGTMSMAALQIINRGTEDLVIGKAELSGLDLDFNLPLSATTATITPLADIEIIVEVDATVPGPISGLLRLHTNDRESPITDIPITGLVTEPQVQVNPVAIDFGAVPRGWTVPRAIEIQNVGYGELIVQDVVFLIGSSDLFTFKSVPDVPGALTNGQRLGFEIEFRSEAEANFNATLSVETNDPNNPSVEIQLTATGASCDLGCPIANGTPSCASGVCDIGSCDVGFYNSDNEAATGCECAEIGSDPGSFCADSVYKGTLEDDGDNAQHTGIIPTLEDEDIVRFFGYDAGGAGQLFGDDYDVRITMNASDPGIQFCVYRFKTGNHQNECFFTDESCPSNRSYRDEGSYGSDDSADYTIKVFRTMSTEPTCTPYTLFMRND